MNVWCDVLIIHFKAQTLILFKMTETVSCCPVMCPEFMFGETASMYLTDPSENSAPLLRIDPRQPPSLIQHYTARSSLPWQEVILVFISEDKSGSWGERMYCRADLLSTRTVFIIDPTVLSRFLLSLCQEVRSSVTVSTVSAAQQTFRNLLFTELSQEYR